eukprot:CAMPEP_0113889162 /NCGR_PEP_ID=MMETSP0780_2-20120614/13319_1 /TAXON_ID=652834 /ORGANISM="Palpitomonas bilix" /LENGTH=151 /DNA_ID=CAMNT_0000878181 /DNA_START=266 /DNA_END=721 /DNA_ORIENTATION=+ /assembly_acc=CAM_ASM_000599
MKFSAAHFTIFSSTSRERLHGHNHSVYIAVTAEVGENGMMQDYAVFKTAVRRICDEWDERMLVPTLSPFLTVESDDRQVTITYTDGDTFSFPRKDCVLMPVRNTTLEEMSNLVIAKLDEKGSLRHVEEVTVKVSSGPGQYGSTTWKKASNA